MQSLTLTPKQARTFVILGGQRKIAYFGNQSDTIFRFTPALRNYTTIPTMSLIGLEIDSLFVLTNQPVVLKGLKYRLKSRLFSSFISCCYFSPLPGCKLLNEALLTDECRLAGTMTWILIEWIKLNQYARHCAKQIQNCNEAGSDCLIFRSLCLPAMMLGYEL